MTPKTCTFYDPALHVIVLREVTPPTSSQPAIVSMRHAAEQVAKAEGFTLFTIPVLVPAQDDPRWLTFEMKPGGADFLRAWPSQVSAEMWMQHHGDA